MEAQMTGSMADGAGEEGPRRARRLLVIHNPTAGRRALRKLARWRKALAALEASVTSVETEAPLHAIELAASADPGRFDAVAVAGGDGTINEAVNGLARSGLPLALLPLGTANVLANELGLPRDLDALARIAAFAPARPVWPAEIACADHAEPWRFLLMAGVGFDAEVVAHLDLRLKRRVGKGAYALGSLAQLLRRACTVDAVIDNEARRLASLVVARAHFYGGRFVLAPDARLDAPHLHAVVFPDSSRLASLRYMAAVVLGCLQRQDDVAVRLAERIDLRGPAGAPVQIDGDIRAHLPASIRLAPAPVRLIA
jgi:diacylglycerol kinase (ATP)